MFYCFIAAVSLKTKFLWSGHHLVGVKSLPPPGFIALSGKLTIVFPRYVVKFHKRVLLPLKSHVHVYKWWAGLLCVYLKNDTQLKIRQFYSSKKKMCYLRFHRIANGTNNYPPLPHCVSSLAWIFNIPIPVLRISRLGTL